MEGSLEDFQENPLRISRKTPGGMPGELLVRVLIAHPERVFGRISGRLIKIIPILKRVRKTLLPNLTGTGLDTPNGSFADFRDSCQLPDEK